jgi:hypothetical protein
LQIGPLSWVNIPGVVVLDRADGEVTITAGWWTKHVRLPPPRVPPTRAGATAEDAASRRAASRRKVPRAGFACGVGLLWLAVAAVVQPQAGGWLVHSVAMLLRIYFGAGRVVAVPIGACLLLGARLTHAHSLTKVIRASRADVLRLIHLDLPIEASSRGSRG